jgi:hypothetical protein
MFHKVPEKIFCPKKENRQWKKLRDEIYNMNLLLYRAVKSRWKRQGGI